MREVASGASPTRPGGRSARPACASRYPASSRSRRASASAAAPRASRHRPRCKRRAHSSCRRRESRRARPSLTAVTLLPRLVEDGGAARAYAPFQRACHMVGTGLRGRASRRDVLTGALGLVHRILDRAFQSSGTLEDVRRPAPRRRARRSPRSATNSAYHRRS